jgi:hypothetical protein
LVEGKSAEDREVSGGGQLMLVLLVLLVVEKPLYAIERRHLRGQAEKSLHDDCRLATKMEETH